MATQSTQAPASQFLTTRAEIVLRIYRFVFERNVVIVKAPKCITRSTEITRNPEAVYQILLTCRFCHEKARQFVYCSTVWVIDDKGIFDHLVASNRSSGGPSAVQHVHLVEVKDIDHFPHRRLPSLKNLAFEYLACSCEECVEKWSTTQLKWAEDDPCSLSDTKILAYTKGLRLSHDDSSTIKQWLVRSKAFRTRLSLTMVGESETDYLVRYLMQGPRSY